jgi:hypothetical protein
VLAAARSDETWLLLYAWSAKEIRPSFWEDIVTKDCCCIREKRWKTRCGRVLRGSLVKYVRDVSLQTQTPTLIDIHRQPSDRDGHCYYVPNSNGSGSSQSFTRVHKRSLKLDTPEKRRSIGCQLNSNPNPEPSATRFPSQCQPGRVRR